MRTAGVKELVGLALTQVEEPYTEHVVDDVFTVIENVPEFVEKYEQLCREVGKGSVNTWGGYWVAQAVKKTGTEQRAARKSSLIRFYPLLDAPGVSPGKKRKEPEALQLMSDYYMENKAKLPAHVRDHRADIIEMIIEGLPVEQVFAMQVDSSVAVPAVRRR